MIIVISRRWRERRERPCMAHHQPAYLFNTRKACRLMTRWLTIIIGRACQSESSRSLP